MSLHVVILAAGEGTRMRSALPKVLQPLAGRPLLAHVLATARALTPEKIHLVYGHGADSVQESFASEADLHWVHQQDQEGTGHAVAQATPNIPADGVVLVLYGDVPLISSTTLSRLVDVAAAGSVAVLTVKADDPAGYGRILRGENGGIRGIVEEKDADAKQREIREVNTGLLAAPGGLLRDWLGRIDNDNAQNEYYLTDVIGLASVDGCRVEAVAAPALEEVMGVNDRAQLAAAERAYQRRQAQRLMGDGLTLADPARFDLRGELEIGQDVSIDVNVVLEGKVKLGDGVRIGPNCWIKDSNIGSNSRIYANSVLEGVDTGQDCDIGPFARLRAGTRLDEGVRIGNFVEVKQASIGPGSKVNHLAYIGDAEIGRNVNIGAGVITCNYDGANKHQTVIEDDVFVGSDTQLVAPVTLEKGATIGAGSTITKDASAGELTVSRSKQTTLQGWKRPKKK